VTLCCNENSSVSIVDVKTDRVRSSVEVQNGAYGVAIDSTGQLAYVTNTTSQSLSVIEVSSGLVIDTFGLPLPPYRIALSPDGSTAYIGARATNGATSLMIVATGDGTLLGSVSISAQWALPEQIAVSADGKFVWLALYDISSVGVVDAVKQQLVNTIVTDGLPTGIVLSPDGAEAYVPTSNPPGDPSPIMIISTSTRQVTGSISVGDTAHSPLSIAINSTGTRAYVTIEEATKGFGPMQLATVDLVSQSVTQTLALGDGVPFRIAITPDESEAFVLDSSQSTLTAVNLNNQTILKVIPVAGEANDLAITPDGSNVLVTNFDASKLGVIDLSSGHVVSRIPIGAIPMNVAISPDGSRAYVSDGNSGNIAFINTALRKTTSYVPVGQSPTAIVLSPDGTRLYTSNSQTSFDMIDTVSVVDTTSHKVVANISPGVGSPVSLAVSNDGGVLYISAPVLGGGDAKSDGVPPSDVRDAVFTVDTVTNQFTARISIPSPGLIKPSPDGNHLYVVCLLGGSFAVAVLNTSTNTFVANVSLHLNPLVASIGGLAVSPDGSTVYVVEAVSHRVYVIDATQISLVTSIPINGKPLQIALTATGNFGFVTDASSKVVTLLNLKTRTVVGTIPVPDGTGGIAIGPE
jgi:YVTN family beta-propeller protein